jgi:hypothetical protein
MARFGGARGMSLPAIGASTRLSNDDVLSARAGLA